jgi:hypothetical protein
VPGGGIHSQRNGSSSTCSVGLIKGQRDRYMGRRLCVCAAGAGCRDAADRTGLPLSPDPLLLLPEDQRAPRGGSIIETYPTGVADAAAGGGGSSDSNDGIVAPVTDNLGNEHSSVQQPENVRTVHRRALLHPLHSQFSKVRLRNRLEQLSLA